MTEKEARELAEKHWHHTEQIIPHQVELMERLYIEAMVHGIKHGQEVKNANPNHEVICADCGRFESECHC